MTVAVKAVPEGYHTVTPYLVVQGAERVIQFLKDAFDGEEIERMPGPNGRLAHAEVRIGDSVVMMGEPTDPSIQIPAMLYVYVPDADAAYARALRAGASSIQEPRTEFYGDRTAAVKDACGNQWYMATHVEDVSHEELVRRSAARARTRA
jgi:PhnB protein